jgi:hypothetical protein
MTTAVLGVRLLLLVVFGAAAVAKLRNLGGFAASLGTFGVPAPAAPVVAIAIPVVELIAAGLLLPATTAPWGATLALALLALFTLVAWRAWVLGTAAACACFGTSATEPVGVWTLVRNGLLMGAGALVLAAGPGSSVADAGDDFARTPMPERALVLWLLSVLTALAGMGWYIGRLRAEAREVQGDLARLRAERAAARSDVASLATEGLAVGTEAPAFDLPCLEGGRASLTSLGEAGRPVVLVFMSAHCTACHQLWPDIEGWQGNASTPFTVAAICSGSDQAIEIKVMGHQVRHLVLEGDSQLGAAYGVTLRPSAVVVAEGRIASPTIPTVEGVRRLASGLAAERRAL